MPEFGELAAVCVPAGDGDDWEFEARLMSVEFVSSIKVSLDKTEVKAPHWTYADRKKIEQPWKKEAKKLKLPRNVFYSKKPAVYSVKQSNPEVEVKIKVMKSKNVVGKAKVKGNLGPLELEGECPTSVSEHTIKLKIVKMPTGIGRIAGGLVLGFDLNPPGVSIVLNLAEVEVFFILSNPGVMFTSKGVPAEVLRFLILKAGLGGKTKPKDATVEITNYFHMAHKLKYDIEGGATSYQASPPFGSISAFLLIDYLFRDKPKVNCYDQAACVQSMGGAVGVDIKWIFMEPFGFINETILVGRNKPTNNPFYRKKGLSKKAKRRMIAQNHPERTGFGNHAFCQYDSKIYDACAGPYPGTGSDIKYIKKAIDFKTTLNTTYGLPTDPLISQGYAKPKPGVIGTS